MKHLGIIQRIGTPQPIPQNSEEDESEEIKRYRYEYYQTQYISIIVDAENEADAGTQADDLVNFASSDQWGESGDIEFSDSEEVSTEDYPDLT